MEERNSIFDNHVAFNRWQVMEGMRVSEGGTEPSVYVSIVKLKKVFNALDEAELRGAFSEHKTLKTDKVLSTAGIRLRKEKLIQKLETLIKEQVFTALNIYNRELDGEVCAKYVLACKRIKREEE